jgi:hypothetical protein
MEGNIWTINGQRVNVEFAESTGTVSVGVLVGFKGYYSNVGEFIVTKIEVKPIRSLKDNQSIDITRDKSDSNNKTDSGGSNDGGSSGGNDSGDDHNKDQSDDHGDD